LIIIRIRRVLPLSSMHSNLKAMDICLKEVENTDVVEVSHVLPRALA